MKVATTAYCGQACVGSHSAMPVNLTVASPDALALNSQKHVPVAESNRPFWFCDDRTPVGATPVKCQACCPSMRMAIMSPLCAFPDLEPELESVTAGEEVSL